MKTLTIGKDTFEIMDEYARNRLDTLENNGSGSGAKDEEIIDLLIQEDMLSVVADSDDAILADEQNNILLW